MDKPPLGLEGSNGHAPLGREGSKVVRQFGVYSIVW